MRSVSFSKLRDFLICPKYYELVWLKKIEPLSSFSWAQKGKRFHQQLKSHGDDLNTEVLIDPQDRKMWDYYLHLIQPYQGNPQFNEWHFYLPLQLKKEKYVLTGQIDRLYRVKDKLVLFEWKTGQASILDEIQIQFYSWVIWQLRTLPFLVGIQEITTCLVYLSEEKTVQETFERQRLLPFHRYFIDILQNMHSTHFLAEPLVLQEEPWCKNCYFKKACIEGRRYNEEPNFAI